jgi:hypothetical protein
MCDFHKVIIAQYSVAEVWFKLITRFVSDTPDGIHGPRTHIGETPVPMGSLAMFSEIVTVAVSV